MVRSARSCSPFAVLIVLLLAAMVPSAAHAGATANVQPTGDLFVGSAGEERNSIQVDIKPGASATAPTTLRVRDTFEEPLTPGPDSGCVKVGGPAIETIYLECQVTVAAVDLVLGPGDDNGEIITANGRVDGRIFGDAGQDTLIGGGGNDILQGDIGIDTLRGGPGSDFLYGQGTEDLMDGQDGSDTLIGGEGGDAMIDTGTTGTDSVTYFESAVGVRVTVDDSAANDGANGGVEGDSVGKGFERVQGSAFDDIIVGAAVAETINGSRGNDQLDGGGGPDRLEGNEGEDTLRARDGVADALLDCDSASSETQGTQDVAIIDPAGVDPDPVRCESVQRATGGGGSSPGLPAATSLPKISPAVLRAGVTATCDPGAWTGAPTFSYGWFATADGTKPERMLATGKTYELQKADEGQLVYCIELATNAAGSVPARSIIAAVVDTVRIPTVRNLPLGAARQRILNALGGQVDFGSAVQQARDGLSIDRIPCSAGGRKGECRRAKLRPGRAFATSPKAGTRIKVSAGPGGKLPRIRVGFYDAGKDEQLPPVQTPKKEGDDCPLAPSFSQADRESFIGSLIGKSEAEAGFFLAFRECRSSVSYQDDREQEADPYVKKADLVQIDGVQGLRLTVSRPKFNDLAIVPFHRRLEGRDRFANANLERGPINPGIGTDGKLTTLGGGAENDVCFAAIEASTGLLVPGVQVRATDPHGESVNTGLTNTPIGGPTNANGVRCDPWPIDESGKYRFTFVKYGGNGINEEGYLDIRAAPRRGSTFVSLAGREIECAATACVQTRLDTTSRRASVAQLEVIAIIALAAAVGEIVRSIQRGRGVDAALAARTADDLGGSQPEASLYAAARDSGITPGVLTLGGILDPSPQQPNIVRGGLIVANDGATIISRDGAGITPGKGGNVVLAAGKLIGQDGAGLIGQDGAGVISGGAGNVIGQDPARILSDNGLGLIGQDGAGVVNRNAGNVIDVGGRAVLVNDSNRLAAGTIVSAGAGNAIPVAPASAGG